MYTRCPQCQAIHLLSAALLASARGRVRCGNCQHVYQSLSSLFDDRPLSTEAPPASDPSFHEPVVGSIILPPPDDTAQSEPPTASPGGHQSWVWKSALALMVVITMANLAWTFREQLLENNSVRDALIAAGFLHEAADEPYRDTASIHLVSRDLHQHPTLAGMLALSATFVSRAPQAQPYPAIELTLTDAGNNAVAQREFSPAEYLPGGHVPEGGLSPGVHVPVLLEFMDPGTRVTGFSLEFH
ncbi:MAG: zinc-ribbon domain-containing protein [Gammaproteobacteria bacterium]|nr:zinc-ribbon domain-containing protein [Gammaproteobacteria bacterium]